MAMLLVMMLVCGVIMLVCGVIMLLRGVSMLLRGVIMLLRGFFIFFVVRVLSPVVGRCNLFCHFSKTHHGTGRFSSIQQMRTVLIYVCYIL